MTCYYIQSRDVLKIQNNIIFCFDNRLCFYLLLMSLKFKIHPMTPCLSTLVFCLNEIWRHPEGNFNILSLKTSLFGIYSRTVFNHMWAYKNIRIMLVNNMFIHVVDNNSRHIAVHCVKTRLALWGAITVFIYWWRHAEPPEEPTGTDRHSARSWPHEYSWSQA